MSAVVVQRYNTQPVALLNEVSAASGAWTGASLKWSDKPSSGLINVYDKNSLAIEFWGKAAAWASDLTVTLELAAWPRGGTARSIRVPGSTEGDRQPAGRTIGQFTVTFDDASDAMTVHPLNGGSTLAGANIWHPGVAISDDDGRGFIDIQDSQAAPATDCGVPAILMIPDLKFFDTVACRVHTNASTVTVLGIAYLL